MTKKIVHIIIGLEVGGAELMLKRLVLYSHQKAMFNHTVISLTDTGVIGNDLETHGIVVHSLGMKSLFSIPKTFLRLRKLLMKLSPDVVQTWMYHADFLGGLAAKSVGIKKIIWGIRTTDVTKGASKLTVVLRSLCAKLSYWIPSDIVCVAYAAKDTHAAVGYDSRKMKVIHNGFELDKFVVTDADRCQIRKELNLTEEDVVVGSVGRFNAVKNQRLFVEVAKYLVPRYPQLKFMMVGRDNDPENKELMSWICQNNLEGSFRLLGQRHDVAKCIKAMDIFCLHSKTEGFPNVLGEAILLEKYVISTNVGDVKYLISDDFIVDLSPVDISNRIESAINNKEYLEKEILANKYMDFSEKYKISKCVSDFEGLYD